MSLPEHFDALAPDGSEVRHLVRLAGGSMAHFRLVPGDVTAPTRAVGVEELWFITTGVGRLWLATPEGVEVIDLVPGMSVAIPDGARFQFRCDGESSLEIVAVTMPPWPGPSMGAEPTEGLWSPTMINGGKG